MTPTRPCLADRPIPEAVAGPVTEEHVPVVLWVHSGTATVEVPGEIHRLAAGEAIWIPPGVSHRTQTDVGSVVFPLFPPAPDLRGLLAEVRVVTIPPGWATWLVFQFDFNKFHTTDAVAGADALLDLVTAGAPDEDRAHAAGPPLPMPRSPAGRAAARALLRSPGSSNQTVHLAAAQHVSVRTLQRQFLNETGISLSEWRTRARVSVAAHHLARGRSVGWTGRHVGYETPAGFTRAFRRHFGVTPQDHALRTGGLDAGANGASGGAGPIDDSRPPAHAPALEARRQPPRVPRRRLWSLVHDCHVLWWTYRGQVTITVGDHEYSLQRGDAIWLPAGVAASVELAEQSVLLPLGERYGPLPTTAGELRTLSFPRDAEAFLLHTVLTEYTLFQPATPPTRLADELFPEAADADADADADCAALTGAVAAIARALRRDPADSRTLADWATGLQLPPGRLRDEIATQTGTSFPAWRALLRMTVARELLRFGEPPSDVSGLLGYASPAVFGKVFTTAHGISPRRYQHRVSARLAIGGRSAPSVVGTRATDIPNEAPCSGRRRNEA